MADTYAQDVDFLRQHADVIELQGPEGARVAVVPEYQGRVMTSRVGGNSVPTGFGWINKPFISAGGEIPRFNNYGGEDRFWIGPEAGQYGLWFRKGEPFDVQHWLTPPAINRGPLAISSQGKRSIAMTREFEVANVAGTTFSCAVQRLIYSLSHAKAAEVLGVELPSLSKRFSMVGFESRNILVNNGLQPWRREGGLLSIWILGQFDPLARGKVIVPFVGGDEAVLGKRATTDYFGELPPERCQVKQDYLLLSCDGEFRSKIGISRRRARNVLGSYDPDAGSLTIVQFNLPPDAAQRPYVNSLWKIQEEPFDGDVVNSYNKGPDFPGEEAKFYELESSSPAAELAPGEALAHVHRTFHFCGEFDVLREMARKILNVDLAEIV